MFPLYTKTFGGKIWKNLHSVSPDNFLDKKFKMASLKDFSAKRYKHHLVQKIVNKTPFSFLLVGETKKIFQPCCLTKSNFERNKALRNA